MYTVKAYNTDHYQNPSIHKDFKDRSKMRDFCLEFLSHPNHKVIIHVVSNNYNFGTWRNRPREVVRKIGVFTSREQLEGAMGR